VRQYQKILEMDGVELIVAESALRAIAREAITRHTGARGLRTVLEEIMLNIMYEIPSRSDIKRCVVTEDTVAKRVEPLLVTAAELKKMLKDKPA
jgi:ATP-dependent Clp protease ATP-binding subunit ClpX